MANTADANLGKTLFDPGPISAEEADRLAESFLPMWEVDLAAYGAGGAPSPDTSNEELTAVDVPLDGQLDGTKPGFANTLVMVPPQGAPTPPGPAPAAPQNHTVRMDVAPVPPASVRSAPAAVAPATPPSVRPQPRHIALAREDAPIPPKSKAGLWIGLAVGFVALAGISFAVVSGLSGGSSDAAPRTTASPVKAEPPAPVPPPPEATAASPAPKPTATEKAPSPPEPTAAAASAEKPAADKPAPTADKPVAAAEKPAPAADKPVAAADKPAAPKPAAAPPKPAAAPPKPGPKPGIVRDVPF